MRRFARILRNVAVALLIIVALYAVFVLEENWRARRDLDRFEATLLARGEKLDLADFTPSPPLGADDLAQVPAFITADEAAAHDPDVARFRQLDVGKLFPERTPSLGDPRTNHPSDWRVGESDATSDNRAAAGGVIQVLNTHQRELNEIAVLVARPGAGFRLDYSRGIAMKLPPLTPLIRYARLFAIDGVASLESNDPNRALRDVQTLFALERTLRDEPLLISMLVRLSMFAQIECVVWEGERNGAWNTAYYAAIDELLVDADLLRDFERTIRAERAYARYSFTVAKRGESLQALDATLALFDSPRFPQWLFRISPLGAVFARNQLIVEQWTQNDLLPVINSREHRVFVDRWTAAERAFTKMPRTPYSVIAKMTLPIYRNITMRIAMETAAIDQMRFACRTAIARSTDSPEPSPPLDLISGQPMKLKPAAGGYRLYSVGWNTKDDGGEIALKGRTKRDDEAGDWVWFGR